jgi:hypothetical protein
MAFTDKIKRDFAKHKGKAGVLAVLAVVMLGFIAKAAFDMSPRTAAAEGTPATAAPTTEIPTSTPDSEARLRQSKELWTKLREVRGTSPALAFTFDNSKEVFPLHPNRKVAVPAPEKTEPIDTTPKQPVSDAESKALEHRNKVLAASRELIVRSTVVGAGTKPVAIVNDQILSVGDRIKGFEVIAIRALPLSRGGGSEVVFQKDKVTIAIEMARNPNQK